MHRLAALSALVLCAAAAPSAGCAENTCFDSSSRTSHAWSSQASPSAVECQVLCLTTSQCSGYSYGDGTCTLWRGQLDRLSLMPHTGLCSAPVYCLPNTDYNYAGDIVVLNNATTDRACAAACLRNAECTGITLRPDSGQCILKRRPFSETSLASSAGWCSAPLLCVHDTDYNAGQELRTVAIDGSLACARRCMVTDGCSGYTIDAASGACALRRGIATTGSLVPRPGSCSAPLYCTANTDYNYYKDMELVQTEDDRMCAHRCMTTTNCTGITFAPDRGSCILKGGAHTLSSSYTNPGWCSAALYCTANTDYNYYKDMGVIQTEDDRVCARKCMQTTNCTGITFAPDRNSCILKGGAHTPSSSYTNPGWCSAPLYCTANTDYNYLGDIEVIQTADDRVCARKCMQTTNCTGITFAPDRNSCILKKGANTLTSSYPSPGWCSAALYCTANTDYNAGHDVGGAPLALADDRVCAARCMATDGCTGIAMLPGGLCALRGGPTSRSSTLDSTGTCSAPLHCFANTDYNPGNSIRCEAQVAPNDHVCAMACMATDGCTGYAVDTLAGLCCLRAGNASQASMPRRPAVCGAPLTCTPNTDATGSGGHLLLENIGDDRLCAAECMYLDVCTAFTFDAAHRTCALSVGARTTTRAPGLCTAELGCRPNRGRKGTVLATSPELRSNDRACSSLCAAASECTAYSVNESLCVLFSGATVEVTERGTCSAATVSHG
eukprot:m51a1_g14744 hypothetical protein (725) ;mRNA; f:303118-305292